MLTESNSAEETFEAGRKMGLDAKPGTVIALSGDLGTGKTVFTKGVAAGLGITEPVVSPTFTLVQIYESGKMPLYHFDVYRIGDISEMDETGYEDCFYGDGVTVVEWAEIIEDILPPNTVRLLVEKDPEKGFDYRRITIDEADSD